VCPLRAFKKVDFGGGKKQKEKLRVLGRSEKNKEIGRQKRERRLEDRRA